MSIVRTHQSWVNRNICKLKVSVLYDHLGSISQSVPVKPGPRYTLRKEPRVFDRDVSWWFFWNNNVSCVLFPSLISNTWSGVVIHIMDFYRTHRDRMARAIGSPWPQDDILLISQLMWGDWGGFWRREGRWYRKIEIGAEMGQTRSQGSCGEQGRTCNSEAHPPPPPPGTCQP